MKYIIIPNTVAVVDTNVTRNNAMANGSNNRHKQRTVLKQDSSPNNKVTVVNMYNSYDTVLNQQALATGSKMYFTQSKTIRYGNTPDQNEPFDWGATLGLDDEAQSDIQYPAIYNNGTETVVARNSDMPHGNAHDYPKKYVVHGNALGSSTHAYTSIGVANPQASDSFSSFCVNSYNAQNSEKTAYQTGSITTDGPTFPNDATSLLTTSVAPCIPVTSVWDFFTVSIDQNPGMTQSAFILLRDADVELEYRDNSSDLTVEYYYLVINPSGSKHYKLILSHNAIDEDYIAKWERTDTAFSKRSLQSGFYSYNSHLCEQVYDVHKIGQRKIRDDQDTLYDVDMNYGHYMLHKELTLTNDQVVANSLPTIILFNEDQSIKSIIYHNKTNEQTGHDVTNTIAGAADYNQRNVLSTGTANPKIDYTDENFMQMLKQIGYKQDTTNHAMGDSPDVTSSVNDAVVNKSKFSSGENQFFKPDTYYSANSYYKDKISRQAAGGTGVSHPHDGVFGVTLGLCVGPITGMTPAEDLVAFNYTLKDGGNTYNTNTACICATKIYLNDKSFFTDFANWHASDSYAYHASVNSSNQISVGQSNPDVRFLSSLEVFPSINLVPARTKLTLNSNDGNVYSIENTTTGFDNITSEYSISITGKLPTPGTGQNPDDGDQGDDDSITIPNYESGINNYIKW